MFGSKFLLTATVLLSSLTATTLCAAELPTKDIAARRELHSIQTLTLSDAQFLKGDSNASATTTTGELRIAQGSGRSPLILLQHGSGGMGANVEMWEREFNAIGISTLALDGFTGRGLTQVSTNQALLGRLNFILDIYRALDVVSKHPRIDTQRVALMGFSRGGQAALYASLRRFQQMWNKSGVEFAAYIPFYPDCATTFVSDTDVIDKPIRIFGGTADDYNPIALCRAYAERLKSAGRDVQVTEYPGTPHSFDNPLGAQPAAVSRDSQSVRNCKISEEPVGLLINSVSKQPFSYKDGCVALNPHVGYDATATTQARQTVSAFIRTVFKVN
jgi:dienelactone hydrolase